MTSKQLRDLFFRTGLPEAYCLAQKRARQEHTHTERGRDHAPEHPGDRSAGDPV